VGHDSFPGVRKKREGLIDNWHLGDEKFFFLQNIAFSISIFFSRKDDAEMDQPPSCQQEIVFSPWNDLKNAKKKKGAQPK
jgi:hypothetical protein